MINTEISSGILQRESSSMPLKNKTKVVFFVIICQIQTENCPFKPDEESRTFSLSKGSKQELGLASHL